MKALFVIDMQEEYMKKYPENLLYMVNQRIAEGQENGELIIYIKNKGKSKNGIVTNDLAQELLIVSNHIYYKEKSSALGDEKLRELLEKQEVTEVTVIGIDGSCCVASCANGAAELGYHATIQLKYVGIQNPARFDKKRAVFKKNGVIVEENNQ